MPLSPHAGTGASRERKSAEDLKGLSSLPPAPPPSVALPPAPVLTGLGLVFSDKDKQAVPKGQ